MKHLLLAALVLLTAVAEAKNKDREFRKGRGGRRGNEASERVTAVSVGQISYAGNGCPAGTMNVVFAPDFLSFSILFDQFVAEVTETGQKRDVMACNAIIPMSVPNGMQMEIVRVDYRGFAGLPGQGHAVLNSVFNFRGQGGDRDRMTLRYRFQGPTMQDYEISTSVLNGNGEVVEDTERSPCGGSFQLRIGNQIKLVSRELGASVTLDSIDGSSNAVYYVNWRACSNNCGGKKPKFTDGENDRRWR
jgi:hypothetical protein